MLGHPNAALWMETANHGWKQPIKLYWALKETDRRMKNSSDKTNLSQNINSTHSHQNIKMYFCEKVKLRLLQEVRSYLRVSINA